MPRYDSLCLCFWLVVSWASTAPAAAWAAAPEGKTHANRFGMQFVRIEPGLFVMGQGEAPP